MGMVEREEKEARVDTTLLHLLFTPLSATPVLTATEATAASKTVMKSAILLVELEAKVEREVPTTVDTTAAREEKDTTDRFVKPSVTLYLLLLLLFTTTEVREEKDRRVDTTEETTTDLPDLDLQLVEDTLEDTLVDT